MSGLKMLPLAVEVETPKVMRKLVQAHQRLAELRGLTALLQAEDLSPTAPRLAGLARLLLRREALASLAIEGIASDYERLAQAELLGTRARNAADTQLIAYMQAYTQGADALVRDGLCLSMAHLETAHKVLSPKETGVRTGAGALVKNMQSQEIMYTPPQTGAEVKTLCDNLLLFMHDDSQSPLDPLLKLAMVHLQFELIRPFPNNNGRMGRIVSMLYLHQKNLLATPLLPLSEVLAQDSAKYFHLLRNTHSGGSWEQWVLLILASVEEAARIASVVIWEIIIALLATNKQLQSRLPKIASPALLQNMFAHPLTTIELVMSAMNVSRLTATKYLQLLAEENFLSAQKIGRNNFYINKKLLEILTP